MNDMTIEREALAVEFEIDDDRVKGFSAKAYERLGWCWSHRTLAEAS
jgi:hypothetical protein